MSMNVLIICLVGAAAGLFVGLLIGLLLARRGTAHLRRSTLPIRSLAWKHPMLRKKWMRFLWWLRASARSQHLGEHLQPHGASG